MLKLLTFDVYRTGMTAFKELADETYQSIEYLPSYQLRKLAKSETPTGYSEAYRLIKYQKGVSDETAGDTLGFIGTQGGGVLMGYATGSTKFGADWLTDVPNPTDPTTSVIVPTEGFLYLVMTEGPYYHTFFKFNATTNLYEELINPAEDGVSFGYITGTPEFAKDWLSDKATGGLTIEPRDRELYLILSDGKYKYNFYRYDETSAKYVEVIGSGEKVLSCYIVGTNPFDNDWLSDVVSGTAIVPREGQLYLIRTTGKYQNYLLTFNSVTNKYVAISGGNSGVTPTYIVGTTEFKSNWLSDEVGGIAITPVANALYLVVTSGKYHNYLLTFDSTVNKYVTLAGDSNKLQTRYIVSGATEFSSGWLTDTDGGTTANTPQEGNLYLILSSGKFKNSIYTYDTSESSYVAVSGGGGAGAIKSYIVGSTEFADDWLSETVGGSALVPTNGGLYLVLTAGKYKDCLFTFDSATNLYVLVGGAGAGGGGATMCYIIAGKTPLDADWLTDDSSSTTAISPDASGLYLVLTTGNYYHHLYRFDETTDKYIEVITDSLQQVIDNIAQEFSSSINYSAGEFVYYNGDLYQFKTAHAAGTWETTDVTNLTVTDALNNQYSMLANEFDATKEYSAGEYCYYNNIIYKFIKNHSVGSWDSTQVQVVQIVDEIPEALTDQDLQDVIDSFVNGMSTANVTGIVGCTVYSTSEKIVGKWIDGRPLYKKTLNLKSPSVIDTFTVIYRPTSEMEIINIDQGKFYTDPGARFGHVFSNDEYLIKEDSSGNIVCLVNEESLLNKIIILTVAYVKSTDTEDSFTYDMLVDDITILPEVCTDSDVYDAYQAAVEIDSSIVDPDNLADIVEDSDIDEVFDYDGSLVVAGVSDDDATDDEVLNVLGGV